MKNNTDAMKKARENYTKKVKRLAVDISPNVYNDINNYCNLKGITKKEFVEKAIPYYIDNN